VRYGCFRIDVVLRKSCCVSAANRERQPAVSGANEMWSMDFVSDALFGGRRLRPF
jgi:hypothetical protein